jgi:hypothetical protein
MDEIDRFPRVRDRALFVGGSADVVPHGFGEGLPPIRPWVEQHFDFTGYVLGPQAGAPADAAALRAELGYAPDERVCVVTVGGAPLRAEPARPPPPRALPRWDADGLRDRDPRDDRRGRLRARSPSGPSRRPWSATARHGPRS